MDQGVLEAARAVRPYLARLVGPTSPEVDSRIADLLAAAERGEDVVGRLRSVMDEHEGTSSFLAEVLVDSPLYRPPYVQPGYQRLTPREGGMKPLAGDPEPVLHAGRYACPHGDYVWYRPAVGARIPPCPTHGLDLIRS